ncbi:hypothetical protein U1Q18_038171 [Sarracenia purpurea var. burkii]
MKLLETPSDLPTFTGGCSPLVVPPTFQPSSLVDPPSLILLPMPPHRQKITPSKPLVEDSLARRRPLSESPSKLSFQLLRQLSVIAGAVVASTAFLIIISEPKQWLLSLQTLVSTTASPCVQP